MAKLLRWTIGTTLLFLTTTGFTLGGKMDKFDWKARESAPQHYVMTIIGGSLGYHDNSGSLYVPDKSDIDLGWGRGISSHIVGANLKPLPSRLNITFFSYIENQFYEGRFDLPYDKILKMFQDGYFSPGKGKEGAHTTYDAIVVGVAPGGAVAVWLEGNGKTTEVFFGQAQKVEKDWSSMTNNTTMSREEYVRDSIVYSLLSPDGTRIEDPKKKPEALAALLKKGVPLGLWSRYRTQYAWQPLLTGMKIRGDLINHIMYFNGEHDYLPCPLPPALAASTRPVPKEMNFAWMPEGVAHTRLMELAFDEAEIFAAFNKLGSNHQPLQLEMRMIKNAQGHDFTVWLRNAQEAIELKLTQVTVY